MMPVAVRLSKDFYARFGDEATNELVTLLNDVDLTYRSELKEAFAGNIAVFDAKLEQRLAENLALMDRRFAEMDAKFEKRLAETVAAIDTKIDERFRAERLDARFAAIDVRFAEMQTTLIRWMFLFWLGSALTIIGFR